MFVRPSQTTASTWLPLEFCLSIPSHYQLTGASYFSILSLFFCCLFSVWSLTRLNQKTKTGFHHSPWHPGLISGLSKQCVFSKYLLRKIIRTFKETFSSVYSIFCGISRRFVSSGIIIALGRILFWQTLTVPTYIFCLKNLKQKRDFDRIVL